MSSAGSIDAPTLVQPSLMKRAFTKLHSTENSEGPIFRVLQWNILADALADPSYRNDFCHVPVSCLPWDYRKDLILKHIADCDPDVICLQEVEANHFEDTFKPELEVTGYCGVYASKVKSSCLLNPNNFGPDGVALFYRSSLFEQSTSISVALKDQNDVPNTPMVLVRLIHKKSKLEVVVATLHLQAKCEFMQMRYSQGCHAMNVLEGFARKSDCVLLCGDFNGEQNEAWYPVVQSSGNFNLKSAHVSATGEEAPYTTWKYRANGDIKRESIDYVWYSTDKLKVRGFLEMPDKSEVPDTLFPSLSYPSDHLSLCYDFEFV